MLLLPVIARKLSILLLAGIFISHLSACVKMGPDYQRPSLPFKTPATFQQTEPSDIQTVFDKDKWWQEFGDPVINQLVAKTLQNNLNIKKAAKQIIQIRSRFVQTRADRMPSLGLQAQGQHQGFTTTHPLTKKRNYQTTDTYSLSLPASFEIDLWGKLARAEEAALAELLQTKENYLVILQSIIAETVSLYLKIESLERRIQVLTKSIEAYQESLALVETRYEHGLTSILDVRQARRILALAHSGLPALKQELGINQQHLAVLTGCYPDTWEARQQPTDYMKIFNPIPSGLPSDLLTRRPDIRAAEARLKSLNAGIGIARASRFPRIALTANLGYSSEALKDLFQPQNQLWSMALGLSQPLFDAGKLKAVEKASRAIYEQGIIEYAQTVLQAFAEVEGALLSRKLLLERRGLILKYLAEARATLQVAIDRYERGLVGYLSVLEAQHAEFGAQKDLIQVDFAILANRISLYRFLGGGWAKPLS